MSRFRLYPTRTHQAALLGQCGHARYVWNLALEQWSMWTRDKGSTPRYAEQARQLTEARAMFGWLRAGSQTVQQQALRDFDHAVRNFYAGTHQRPTWRKAALHEGFRVVGGQASRVIKLSRKWAAVNVPKVGWVRFRMSRAVPEAKSYRITRDRAGRWHIAFAVIPPPIPAPGTGEVVGVDHGVTVSAALSTGELLTCPGLSEAELERFKRLQRRLARCRRGSNRRALVKAAIAKLHARARERRTDWVEKINPAFTSQTCSVCRHCAPDNRKSQAVFRCVACGHRANADVNAAVNIAAGRAVSARREMPVPVSPKREPQLTTFP
ncbi:RNA-guided endonuclease InsQ/TnpB family protein [Kribbella sp. NPDC050241]|uniref:RNA-guided endonuclease InsQ/TnpB family protein n=1 Tax=Kribbella sp. NPDC050241 TaxID=3364115 RepID=UPI0037A195FD